MYDVVRLADGVVVQECATMGFALSKAAEMKRRWKMRYAVVKDGVVLP